MNVRVSIRHRREANHPPSTSEVQYGSHKNDLYKAFHISVTQMLHFCLKIKYKPLGGNNNKLLKDNHQKKTDKYKSARRKTKTNLVDESSSLADTGITETSVARARVCVCVCVCI